MKNISSIFIKGLTVILPIWAAIYIVQWLIKDSEVAVRNVLIRVIPEQWYLPGMGLVTLAVFIFLVGLLMYPWLTRRVMEKVDSFLRQVPLFSSIYSPIKDLMDLAGGDMKEELAQVVMIKVPNTEMETLGFITRDSCEGLPEGFSKEDSVVVYVQWSSQVGGYCFIVPRSSVRKVDMSIEEGMRWALTAGLSAPKV